MFVFSQPIRREKDLTRDLGFCSGAVGMGYRELGLERKPTNPEMKRAVAGVGQSRGLALKLSTPFHLKSLTHPMCGAEIFAGHPTCG